MSAVHPEKHARRHVVLLCQLSILSRSCSLTAYLTRLVVVVVVVDMLQNAIQNVVDVYTACFLCLNKIDGSICAGRYNQNKEVKEAKKFNIADGDCRLGNNSSSLQATLSRCT